MKILPRFLVLVFLQSAFWSLVFSLSLPGPALAADSAAASSEHRKTWKIGVITSLSGPIAPMGEAFKRGFELFQRENPNSPLEFLFEDHRYDGKAAVSAFRKLKDFNHVDLNIVWGNTPGDSCAPIAEQEKFPTIAISMNPVSKGRTQVLSLGPPLEKLLAKVLEQFKAWNLAHPEAVSIDIGNALKGMEDLKISLNGNFNLTVVASEEADFKSILLGLRARHADGLVLLLMPQQAMTFLKQAKDLNFFPKIIGGDVFADQEFRAAGAKLSPGLSYVYGAVDPVFVEKVASVYRNTSYFFETATGYTVAMLAQRAWASGTPKILDSFASVKLDGVPILGLELKDSQDLGRHFESAGSIYRADGKAP